MDKKLAIPALALLALLGSGCDVAEVATAPDEETKHVTTSDQATDDEPNADQGAAADAAVSGDVRSLRKQGCRDAASGHREEVLRLGRLQRGL